MKFSLSATFLVLVFALPGCGMFGPPVDLNRDGRIDNREAAQPAVAVAKDAISIAVPGAAPIVNWLYDLIYPAVVAGGAVVVSKKGSKKRHAEQDNRHKRMLRAVRDENKALRDAIVELSKKTQADVTVPKMRVIEGLDLDGDGLPDVKVA